MSLTANSASIPGLAVAIRPGGNSIASRALAPTQSCGASRASKVAAFPCGWTAGSGAYGGGEWVKVGAHELTTRPARAAADDSGFIVSESLTPLSRFHHGAGGAD